MTSAINTYKALVVKKSSGSVYAYDAHLTDLPLPKLNPGQVLVKVNAAAFNHRDVR